MKIGAPSTTGEHYLRHTERSFISGDVEPCSLGRSTFEGAPGITRDEVGGLTVVSVIICACLACIALSLAVSIVVSLLEAINRFCVKNMAVPSWGCTKAGLAGMRIGPVGIFELCHG